MLFYVMISSTVLWSMGLWVMSYNIRQMFISCGLNICIIFYDITHNPIDHKIVLQNHYIDQHASTIGCTHTSWAPDDGREAPETCRLLLSMYVCIYRVQNVFLRCPTPRLHCFLSSHWPSFRFLSFMAFFIPSIQFFFCLPRVLFCFGIHFNAIWGRFLLPFFEHGHTMWAGSVQSLL